MSLLSPPPAFPDPPSAWKTAFQTPTPLPRRDADTPLPRHLPGRTLPSPPAPLASPLPGIRRNLCPVGDRASCFSDGHCYFSSCIKHSPWGPPSGPASEAALNTQKSLQKCVRACVRLGAFSWERGPTTAAKFSTFLDPEEGKKPCVVLTWSFGPLHAAATSGTCPARRPLAPVKPPCAKRASTGPSNAAGDVSTRRVTLAEWGTF